MNKKFHSVIAAALLFVTPLAIACDYPQRADVPNGSTASKDEMLAGQKSVKTYMASMEAYLACIEAAEEKTVAGLGEISEEEKTNRSAALTKKYNAAVAEMELIAARFNEEVRAYKESSQ